MLDRSEHKNTLWSGFFLSSRASYIIKIIRKGGGGGEVEAGALDGRLITSCLIVDKRAGDMMLMHSLRSMKQITLKI